MRRLTFLFALTTLAIVWMQSTALAESNTWQTYANPRFGTTANYPAFLFINREPPPENGDGQAFTNKDETAKLSVYGSFNSEGYTPSSYMKELIRPHDAITYERVAKTFSSRQARGEKISGTSGAISSAATGNRSLLRARISDETKRVLEPDRLADQPIPAYRLRTGAVTVITTTPNKKTAPKGGFSDLNPSRLTPRGASAAPRRCSRPSIAW